MQIGDLIGVGRDADVFAVGDTRVLRQYRDGSSARGEVEVMAYLASRGYPVPAVYPNREYPDDLLMERLNGPTMLAALAAGELTPSAAGRMLASLLARLHAIPAPSGSAARILHLDLHPGNVILAPDGSRVIDWRNSREGPPGLDWAMSGLILAQVAVDGIEGVPQPTSHARPSSATRAGEPSPNPAIHRLAAGAGLGRGRGATLQFEVHRVRRG